MVADIIAGAFRDSQSLLVTLLVFLAAGTLAFALMAVARARVSVKRRHARIMDGPRQSRNALRYSSARAVSRIIDYPNKR